MDDEQESQSHLSLRALLIGRVHEDASIADCAMNVRHHRPHIPGSIWGTAILGVSEAWLEVYMH